MTTTTGVVFPRVRCAVCGVLIVKMKVTFPAHGLSRTLRVWCHGDVDEMTLYDHELAKLTGAEIRQLEHQEGVAFASRRITSTS